MYIYFEIYWKLYVPPLAPMLLDLHINHVNCLIRFLLLLAMTNLLNQYNSVKNINKNIPVNGITYITPISKEVVDLLLNSIISRHGMVFVYQGANDVHTKSMLNSQSTSRLSTLRNIAQVFGTNKLISLGLPSSRVGNIVAENLDNLDAPLSIQLSALRVKSINQYIEYRPFSSNLRNKRVLHNLIKHYVRRPYAIIRDKRLREQRGLRGYNVYINKYMPAKATPIIAPNCIIIFNLESALPLLINAYNNQILTIVVSNKDDNVEQKLIYDSTYSKYITLTYDLEPERITPFYAYVLYKITELSINVLKNEETCNND